MMTTWGAFIVDRSFTQLYAAETPAKPRRARLRSTACNDAALHPQEYDMEEQTNTPNPAGKPPRLWRRVAIATLIGGLVAGVGFKALAHGGPFGGHRGWHMGPGGGGQMDPESLQRRTEAMAKYWLADVDASEAQQKRIAEIMALTMKELAPLREKHMEARKQVMSELTKPQIDRAALESIRAQELALAEQFSRRITQSIADAAEVLTPDQRAKLAEKMAQRRERHRRG
jgi:Spy/CpxP family protein refolding chaperone